MRLETAGLIDRTRPVAFTFDGARVPGWAGDTVASALLGAGRRLVGRSFKYHRPRGILTAGPEEPNALVEIREGAQRTPNVRATVQEIHDRLEVRSQNAWPGLGLDLLAVNDLFARFFGAGFYYKTFMWPRSWWERVYEPAIRRAAGIGRLSRRHDEAHYEKAWAHCDLLVIGAGPTGLMAALAAARAGADVILAEQDFRLGGRLLADRQEIAGGPAMAWVEATAGELAAHPNVRVMPRTTVFGAYDDGVWGAVERVGLHLAAPPAALARECVWRIAARRAILAAGALERPIAFPGNDRPGVMLASAVRAYANRWSVAAGRAVSVFTTCDSGRAAADDLVAAGVNVVRVIDARADASALSAAPLLREAVVTGTRGRHGLTAIRLREAGGGERWVESDCLAVAGGWTPTVGLSCHRNNRPLWREDLAAFVPAPDAVPGMTAAGAVTGLATTAACLAEGLAAAATALEALGRAAPALVPPAAEDVPRRARPLWAVEAPGRAFLDFANDVTTKDVRLAAAEGYASVEHMKRYTTQGMAPDQGRNSNLGALALLAAATGQGIAETGTTTYRPPFAPVAIAALGAGGRGKGFAPERRTTSDAASRERGAPMLEAGLWYRPAWFPRSGEIHWRESCDREVATVRTAVGVCDVSTLGKIDIQGPDAGSLLDLVYTGTFSTLPVGRTRYGLMLREDGFVMDDGTSARLAPDHFVMTTTTAAAGPVMRHLEFVTQALRPDLDVRLISVTEEWAQFALAGPRARLLLGGVLDTPPDLPFMGCAATTVMGIAGRLFRISFSGEEGYEIAVPARHGAALFRDLVARAETLGGGPYGMEALNVLRIEKGFITHAEIHGRVTVGDLGLQGMCKRGDFIGRAAAARPGLAGPGREELVGLRAADPATAITAGAHLFNPGERVHRETDQGYVTSSCFSPTVGGWIGLGFLRDGRARIGSEVRLVDHLRQIDARCTVTRPAFFDETGGRMRG